MSENAAALALLGALKKSGVGNRPGKVLYSGLATLKPAVILLLGYNPGGDPADETETAEHHLSNSINRRPDWNEYLDAAWSPGGRRYAPGRAPMQRRVAHLLEGIGYATRSVCASNLIFVRSRNAGSLEDQESLALRCWPVHEFILEIVQPRCIVTLGGEVSRFVCSKGILISRPDPFPSGHGNWKCSHFTIKLLGRKTSVISLPHLSRYAVDHHPEVIAWVSNKIQTLCPEFEKR